jgi:IS5 family transposase
MRQERTVQASIFDLFAGHEIGRELKAMSAWLDDHRELSSLVAADLRQYEVKATGRRGAAGGVGVALRVAQATPPAELSRAGVPS